MQYLISFLEGIITFISPCLLPMLPVYISYFAGGGERTGKKTLINALGFVLGFTAVFVAMGALAGTLGSFLRRYQTWVNIIGGMIVIVFGLNYLGVLKLKYLADNDFADLSGEALKAAIEERIRQKGDVSGTMASQGTTPRRLTDLIGSLCDLTSGSGDKGTPVIHIQGYFDNYTN